MDMRSLSANDTKQAEEASTAAPMSDEAKSTADRHRRLNTGPMLQSAFIPSAATGDDKLARQLEAGESRVRASTSPSGIDVREHRQQQPQQHHSEGLEILLSDGQVTRSPEDMLCDDLCMLCESCCKSSSGRGLQLDPPPGNRRWKKLPCLCTDRYLHVCCLEAAFLESNILRRGWRRLIMSCPVCATGLRVTRQRGRRTCDRQACLSFFRHFLSVLLISSFLLAFGFWSMFYLGRWTPHAVNITLLVIGSGLLLAFAVYEIWLLHGRFEFVIARLSPRSGSGRSRSSVDMEGSQRRSGVNRSTVQA